MAVLNDQSRAIVMAEVMRTPECPGAVSKADLRAAINAIDDWVDTNASAFNTTIPQPARGILSARQKAALLTRVVEKRFSVS